MSTTTPEWGTTLFEGEQLRDEIQVLLDSACPDRALLSSVGGALRASVDDPSSEYHRYIDPDAFWYGVAWPRCEATTQRCATLVDQWAQDVGKEIEVQEQVLADRASIVGFEAVGGEVGRSELVDEVVTRCEALHEAIEAAGAFDLNTVAVDRIAAQFDQYLTRDGGAGAEDLRSTLPWRHQELLILAHRQAAEIIGQRRDQHLVALVARIMPIGEAAVEVFDAAMERSGSVPSQL
ncbi:MAG: hypothetical protein IH940_12905 [Acidobacteria bacterium]|nr:hypothetical protein [Acidobacteriota bacterium]